MTLFFFYINSKKKVFSTRFYGLYVHKKLFLFIMEVQSSILIFSLDMKGLNICLVLFGF